MVNLLNRVKLRNVPVLRYYIGCWRCWADFSGRARRREYLIFFIFNALILRGVYLLYMALAELTPMLSGDPSYALLLPVLVMLVPSLAVSSRRLHDCGYGAGWLIPLYLTPLIFLSWIFFLWPSRPEGDRFWDYPVEEWWEAY